MVRLKKDGGVKFNNTVALTRLGEDPAATVSKARCAALVSPDLRLAASATLTHDTAHLLPLIKGVFGSRVYVTAGVIPSFPVAFLSESRPWYALSMPRTCPLMSGEAGPVRVQDPQLRGAGPTGRHHRRHRRRRAGQPKVREWKHACQRYLPCRRRD